MNSDNSPSTFCRVGLSLINWNSVEFTEIDEETKHLSIVFKSGFIKVFKNPADVTAIIRYTKLYPDLLDPKTLESITRYARSLKSKIQTDMPRS